jgi:hypothetical protein
MTVANQLPKWKMVTKRIFPDVPFGYKLATMEDES